jgi:uncharacterized protein (DUF58 family)
MAAGMGRFKSRTFHFSYGPRAGWYSGLVAIALSVIAVLGLFSIALLLLALVLVAAVLAMVARWFRGHRLPAHETSALPQNQPNKIVARLKGPQGS